jgi:hypothetical protein
MTDLLTEQHWQVAAALVREAAPDAAGMVLHGGDTENGVRLSLVGVLGPGRTPLTIAASRLEQLEDELEYSLLWLAEHEDEQALRGDHTHELPAPAPRRYLITTAGGITPQVHGSYAGEDERDEAARRLHAAQDPDTDAVFFADVATDGTLKVEPRSGGFFEPDEPAPTP